MPACITEHHRSIAMPADASKSLGAREMSRPSPSHKSTVMVAGKRADLENCACRYWLAQGTFRRNEHHGLERARVCEAMER